MRKPNLTKIILYILDILKQMYINIKLITKRVIRKVLRRLMSYKRLPGPSGAGFVLPTVTMVMLVVILLTIAISLRSFNRVEDARNVRVNQAVLNAAAPALDRAKAKLEELLVTNPPTTDTPTDDALYLELTTTIGGDKYTFGDEQRLRVGYKIRGNTLEEAGDDGDLTTIEDNEITETAWRFPVDTDNNGQYDSFTIYGIFFRTPQRQGEGFAWARTPLDARTPPMASVAGSTNQQCQVIAGTSTSLVGDSGWYKSGSKLKKSFFTYTVTVPINNLSEVTGDYDPTNFETFTGTTGYSALEYQQDWSRIPLTNNAVVYEDDLEIAPGPDFRLNGRIQANGNLIISSTNDNDIDLYLVSSRNSCFYEDEENSKILVGGNVINGLVERDGATDIDVHLQQGKNVEVNDGDARITQTHQSVTTNSAQEAAYNSQASQQRIQWLVDAQIAAFPDTDSPEDDGYGFAEQDDDQANDDPTDDDANQADPDKVISNIKESSNKPQARINALETYFKERVRKVPFAEVAEGVEETQPTTLIAGSGEELRPAIDAWVLPTNGDINTGETGGPTNLTLDLDELIATHPDIVEDNDGVQNFVGDRVLVGNNLPQKIWDNTNVENPTFVSDFQQDVDDGTTKWLDAAGNKIQDSNPDNLDPDRTRKSRVATIADVGSTDRDGFWEDAAATEPEAALDGIGGLRVITGAGVYERENSFLPPPPTNPDGFTVVWPDTMPMSPAPNSKVFDNESGKWSNEVYADVDKTVTATDSIDPSTEKYAKGDLRMRATAVYHYANDFINDTDDSSQAPIACVSSYYDPSTSATAATSDSTTNGIVYGPPGERKDAATYDSTTELFSGSGLLGKLADQANMVFPNGRFVNEKLRDALQKADAARSLSEQAAFDSTMCALGILGDSEVPLGTAPTYIPPGAIKEVSLLDARQIKASDPDNTTTTDIDETFTIFDLDGDTDVQEVDLTTDSNLSLEERQPLEIRATQLDLNLLRTAAFTPTTSVGPRRDNNEYLLPLSGIIYASRDDALPDRSDPNSTSNEDLANSPYDYKLDPTRRPNGIMLINGETVARPAPGTMTPEEVTKEKGLTLVSNLPVYIQGDFNLHTNSSQDEIEEFTDQLDDDWGDFYSRDGLDGNFACRGGDPRLSQCTAGDNWRPVNILADSLSLLSNSWRPGFRNEGDFDLRNNSGGNIGSEVNPVTIKQKRQFNGFFANNYATNGLSSGATFDGSTYTDASYTGPNNQLNSSYFNNFVTPVQRRIDKFPEYVMEVCPKLPVSACEPDDWVVDVTNNLKLYDLLIDSGNGFDDGTDNYFENVYLRDNIALETEVLDTTIAASSLESGTTATIPDPVQRFPRRVAYLRNKYGELEMDEDKRPIPIGVDDSGNVRAYPYGSSASNPLPRDDQNNVLWFRTTTESDSPTTNATYAADEHLFYLSYDESDRDNSGNKLPLPPTPEINGFSLTDDTTTDNNNDAYRYTFCIADANGVGSKDYFAINKEKGITVTPSSGCPNIPSTKIQEFRQALMGLDASDDTTAGGNPTISSGGTTLAGDTNEDGMVVYEISGGTIAAGTTITLEGDSNDIFVLRVPASPAGQAITFGSGVNLQLIGGVNPNNIFWVSDAGMTFQAAAVTTPNLLAGNFIGNNTTGNSLTVGAHTKILGGRFLGFNGGVGSGGLGSIGNVQTGVDIRAITNQGNPSLVPVLQIHEPDAANAGAEDIDDGDGDAANNTGWMVRATETTFNLVTAAGDTPSRPGQSNGGLQNFVRFQENWQKPTQTATNISGSFIQLRRSKYATAPQQQLKREDVTNEAISTLFGYPQKYNSGAAGGILGFQAPPNRNWGFDVGLLSQSPDLFAQKFSSPSSDAKPDEFYREVGRDDPWIEALLCAEDETGNDITSRVGVDCTDYDD
ncbi:MAG: hormogonium polysaccharide biosynthesis protein HpsA [Microcoleaceae cyanobacterium MO_207.B10]|nr:hormogonium polysaccharide biosynthesis protein HpsA [Microcoleaceae cyanobacterium MO_207.B10]